VELSSARQKLLFVVIVAVLAVFGYVLIVPGLHKHSGAVPTPSSHSSGTAVGAPSTAAPVATAQAPNGTANIYDWLPFTQQDLGDAAAVAVRFGVVYDTFTYTESAANYVGAMNGLITGQLAATLQNAYSAPGVQGLHTAQKQMSTATASIVSLRAFGSFSLTFIVNIAQRLQSSRGVSNGSQQYAVTVTGSGGSWRVSDIELSTVGNA
jgi:hypothetical protein